MSLKRPRAKIKIGKTILHTSPTQHNTMQILCDVFLLDMAAGDQDNAYLGRVRLDKAK